MYDSTTSLEIISLDSDWLAILNEIKNKQFRIIASKDKYILAKIKNFHAEICENKNLKSTRPNYSKTR